MSVDPHTRSMRRCLWGKSLGHAFQVLGILFVDKVGQVSAIIEDHVEWLSTRESSKSLLDAPQIFLLSLAFPRVNRNTSDCNGSSGMILSGEDVLR
jgi:hypothetical protein